MVEETIGGVSRAGAAGGAEKNRSDRRPLRTKPIEPARVFLDRGRWDRILRGTDLVSDMKHGWLALVLVGGLVDGAWADEFRLVGGKVVRGEVLKETEDAVFVDMGFRVLRLPKESIEERHADPSVEEVAPRRLEFDQGLYTEAELEEITVREAVDRYAEGVVLIKVPNALGSGFIIDEDGFVITNSHVVQGATDVSITVYQKADGTFEKKTYDKVRLVAVNPTVDLALLKIEDDELAGRKLSKVYLGDMDDVEVGQTVFCVGAPQGLERSVSEGIVSLRNRAADGITYLQIDAAVNPGNSGGPLFNTKGEVVGVNTWGYLAAEGLNFSIPIDYVKHFIANHEAFGYGREHPNTGVRYLEPPRRPQRGKVQD